MYIVCLIIMIFFAVIGLCAFISAIVGMITCSGNDEIILVIPDVDENTAEMRIRKAANLSSRLKNSRVICLCDKDNSAIHICELFSREYSFVEIMNKEKFKDAF